MSSNTWFQGCCEGIARKERSDLPRVCLGKKADYNQSMKVIGTILIPLFLFGCSLLSKKVITRYENGVVASEGYLTGSELKAGVWIEWYQSGQKYSEGRFKNGKTNFSKDILNL